MCLGLRTTFAVRVGLKACILVAAWFALPSGGSRVLQHGAGDSNEITAGLDETPVDGVLWKRKPYWQYETLMSESQMEEAHRLPADFFLGAGSKLFKLAFASDTVAAAAVQYTSQRVRVHYAHVDAQPQGPAILQVTGLELLAVDLSLHADDSMERRELGAAKTPKLSQLDLPTDVRWVAPDLKVIVFIVDMCGKGGGVAATQEQVWNVLKSNSPNNVRDYYQTCSKGTTKLDLDNSKVVGPITMPCSGVAHPPGYLVAKPWTVTSCKDYNPIGWFSYVEDWADKNHVDLDQYTHRIMILPKKNEQFMESTCDWGGLSTQGSMYMDLWNDPLNYKFGYIWLAGDAWGDQTLIFHEMGHNLYLQHATEGGCEYCDMSSAMGGSKGYGFRCYNSPQNWQLGWANPLVTLTSADLWPGSGQQSYWLPAAHTEHDNHMRIVLMYPPDDQECKLQLWVELRMPSSPYDKIWKDSSSYGVFLHRWNGRQFYLSEKPSLLATLVKGSSYYTGDDCGLRISMGDYYEGFGEIRVCRKSGNVERDCFDRLDDDCDGLVDEEDPDCKKPPPPGGLQLKPPMPKKTTNFDEGSYGFTGYTEPSFGVSTGIIADSLADKMIQGGEMVKTGRVVATGRRLRARGQTP